MQEFQIAKILAEENYQSYKDNPYHIQAYFSCLIKSEKSRENKEILLKLINDLQNINTDVAKKTTLRCKAQMEVFYNDNQVDAIRLIDEAIDTNHNIHYARLVKFEICERFNLLDDMKDIVAFFEQKRI